MLILNGVWRAAVLTVSDRVARGAAEDTAGPALSALLRESGFDVVEQALVADEPADIERELRRLCGVAALVVTTGGTGLGPRDRTPEATAALGGVDVPGIAEEMRRAGREETAMAVLSRGIAIAVGSSLVVNLPGSPRGATASLAAVLGVLPHALSLLAGDTDHS